MKRFLGGLLAACALAIGGAEAQPRDPFDLQAMSGAERTAFLRAMPKGGDLHLHLAGSAYPETYLQWAIEDGVCIDPAALSLAPPPCSAPLRPASDALSDNGLWSRMLDSLSTRQPGFADRSGHDQFFTAFDRFGATDPKRAGDMLADVMQRMAIQNTWYVEVMVTPQSRESRAVGRAIGWKGDMRAQAAAGRAQLEALVPGAIAQTDALEARARDVLGCATPHPAAGCQVTVRYLVQSNRLVPLQETFAQLQLGVALIARDHRWVGLQLVAPEDHPSAIRNYAAHMQMVGFLSDHGRKARVALHAGELTPAFATPGDLSFHIASAVRDAGASRIGHGVDLAYEDGAAGLVREMAERGVMVEVNLTSNAVILGVSGDDHPWRWLRSANVPFALSTDDPGISRSELSQEYARGAGEGMTYADLRRSARNALAFSFLAGESLWTDAPRYERATAACAADLGRPEPSRACAAFLARSDKAREQFRFEARLAAFEASVR
ncbi:MAG: adenosine deaminase [Caulobacteraceae bacterium]|nr:adenosine deaminase [Caulobacteraceae bacterium]